MKKCLSILLLASIMPLVYPQIESNPETLFAALEKTALGYAFDLLGEPGATVSYFDVLYNLEEVPVVAVFEFNHPGDPGNEYLTIGISLNDIVPKLTDHYAGESIEKRWRAQLKFDMHQKIIVHPLGTFLKTGDREYIRYPDNMHVNVTLLNEIQLASPDLKLQEYLEKADKSLAIKRPFESNVSMAEQEEFIVPGVPIYLWYLNCLLTSTTMHFAYWNDHGYPSFIPGGNSADGHYWAVTEESCYWTESTETRLSFIPFYAQASQYGNDYTFDYEVYFNRDYGLEEFWNIYVALIDEYIRPLEVGWSGPPYGAHSTVGVGYKIEGDQRFLILHDTWRDVPYYVDYDQYQESLNAFVRHYPVVEKKSTPLLATTDNADLGTREISISTLDLDIFPALEPADQAYHSFELADLNNDELEDLIVCNFRNQTYPAGMHVYLNDGSKFNLSQHLRPEFGYECYNITKTFDFDKDGDLDIAATGYWASVMIYLNEGGTINETPVVVDDEGRGFLDLGLADIDQDGDMDMVSSSVRGEIRVYMNQEGGFVQTQLINMESQSFKLELEDLNNDSWPDLVASRRSGTIILFYNKQGSFADIPDFQPEGHGGMSCDISDINNDGRPDIIAANDGKVILYSNQYGSFIDDPIILGDSYECYPKAIEAADLNQDTYPDIIVGSFNRPNLVFLNNHGEIDPVPAWEAAEVDPTVSIRIFDNDQGKRRILMGKSRGGTLDFYEVDYLRCDTPDTTYQDVSICEGESYNGWTESGEYRLTYTSSEGCDSLVITDLMVIAIDTLFESVSICEGESYNGWTESGEYRLTYTSSEGCDSLVITDLMVIAIDTLFESVSICEGESYNGWTESGEYRLTYTSSEGCDSLVITDLMVIAIDTLFESVSICEGESYNGWTESGEYRLTYTSSEGCDSLVITDLMVIAIDTLFESVSICEGESYNGWTEEGQYTSIFTSSLGCDSVIITDLLLYPAPPVPQIELVGDTLVSDNASGYQWYRDGALIPGATSRHYIPVENGQYHVVVTDDHGCISPISNIVVVHLSSVDSKKLSHTLIYPNPATTEIFVDNMVEGSQSISIYDFYGREVLNQLVEHGLNRIDISKLPSGMYLVQVKGSSIFSGRFIVK